MATSTTTATKSTSAKKGTSKKTVNVQPATATVPVEVKTAPVETPAPATAKAEYTSEKIGRKTIKGNLGNPDNMSINENGEGAKFLTFDLCVNGKDEDGKETKTWYTVRTSLVQLKDILTKGQLLEVEGNHFINTRQSDQKTYNRLNAFKVTFC